MRPNTSTNISASNAATTNGSVILIQNVFAVSAQAINTGTPTGSVKLQASNDPVKGLATDSNGNLVPVNWTDIANTSTSISAAGSVLIPKVDVCYQWLRAVYIDTATNSSEVTAVTTGASAWKFTAPVSGHYQVTGAAYFDTGTATDITVYKNGSADTRIAYVYSAVATVSGSTLITLNAGDYIDLRVDASVTLSGSGAPYITHASIHRIGN